MSMLPNIEQENCHECRQELYLMFKRQLKQVQTQTKQNCLRQQRKLDEQVVFGPKFIQNDLQHN